MKPVIQIFEGLDGWYIRIVSANGATILVSESYTRKFSARRAATRASRIFGGLKILEVLR